MTTNRTRIRRSPNRSAPNKAIGILTAGLVAHVAFGERSQPFAIPFCLLLRRRKSTALVRAWGNPEPAVRILGADHSICITVTLLDALVYSRTAFDHIMETPTIGQFKNSRGDLYDQEFFQGRSIYVRYSWLDIKPDSCRWEQAFSARTAERHGKRIGLWK